MSANNQLIISLVVFFTIADTILAILHQKDITLYLVFNIVLFIILALYFKMNPRATIIMRALSYLFFVAFAIIAAFKIINLL